MAECDCPDPEEAIKPVLDALREVRAIAEQAVKVGTEARDEARQTNGKVLRHSEIFFGPADSRGEHTGEGLLYRVNELGRSLGDAVKELRGDLTALSKQTTGMSAGDLRASQVWKIVLTGAGVIVAAVGVLVAVLTALN